MTTAVSRRRYPTTDVGTPTRAAATPTRVATDARRPGVRPPGLRPQPDYGRYGEPQQRRLPRPGLRRAGGTAATTTATAGRPPGYGRAATAQGDYPAGGANVTLQLDDGSGRTYQLREGANVIGRGQDAQFRLPDTGVSRRHLEIRWDGQVALLADLNSTNGTTVNNAPVQEWQLADGDVIRLGHSEIIVRVH